MGGTRLHRVKAFQCVDILRLLPKQVGVLDSDETGVESGNGWVLETPAGWR